MSKVISDPPKQRDASESKGVIWVVREGKFPEELPVRKVTFELTLR